VKVNQILPRGETIQESRSWKWFQEAGSSFKKAVLGNEREDKRQRRRPLSRSTLWGIEEFLTTKVV
jgi:hypothetical protein